MVENSFEFWKTLQNLFSDPYIYFEKLQQGIKNSILMYAIVGTLSTGASYFISIGTVHLMGGGPVSNDGFYTKLPFILLGIGFLLTFMYSGLVHTLCKIFNGKGTYSDSYNVYTYSIMPYLILRVVPIIGFFSIIYTIVLAITGISTVHKISKGQAAVACLLPAILGLGLLTGFAVILISRVVP